jgi:hypothetical protein
MELQEHSMPEHSMMSHGPIAPTAKRPEHGPLDPHAFSDSNWATCLKT